jgi:hypothetical protein
LEARTWRTSRIEELALAATIMTSGDSDNFLRKCSCQVSFGKYSLSNPGGIAEEFGSPIA